MINHDCWNHDLMEHSEAQAPSHQIHQIHPSLLESCSGPSAAPSGPSSQQCAHPSRMRRASIGTKAQEVIPPAETSLPAPQVYKKDSKKSRSKSIDVRHQSNARKLSNAMEGFERVVTMKKQSEMMNQLKRQSTPNIMFSFSEM
ncbi:hypothetical protein GUITHDRAFT_114838 [Guillardia theta CCMP2712]|uniref:Uncharacterized protein n=1 Tax=Guillardia theta (strain CCMP2712) TaxID=905079 RepID=L1IRU1_GUITC|nr:hypothetical protein GUITHDRAFT_114838 [Guillardia theta CCMP2712]EKX38958.1 hypothetical protein GUITHDRAFT_114838 [Guillardia theta CCMP2712]|eukprot:XP_005825938.1 hypothetical protein GUITHDRAFT_114838 [Guillardia theta CCMP2712]